MSPAVPRWRYAVVGGMLFLAFLAAVLLRPDLQTVMASGAAAVVFLKVLYDYMEGGEDVDAMFEAPEEDGELWADLDLYLDDGSVESVTLGEGEAHEESGVEYVEVVKIVRTGGGE